MGTRPCPSSLHCGISPCSHLSAAPARRPRFSVGGKVKGVGPAREGSRAGAGVAAPEVEGRGRGRASLRSRLEEGRLACWGAPLSRARVAALALGRGGAGRLGAPAARARIASLALGGGAACLLGSAAFSGARRFAHACDSLSELVGFVCGGRRYCLHPRMLESYMCSTDVVTHF